MKPTAIAEAPSGKPFADRRLAREWTTVCAMIRIYCRDHHHEEELCDGCQALRSYVQLRLERCHFGEDKPTCAKCPVHCYQKARRDEIKAIMRYAGPKMLWEHPCLSLWHFWDGWTRKADSASLR